MNDGKASNRGAGAEPQPKSETTPTAPNASMPNQGAGWASAPTSQVIRTVAVALLTTVVVLVAIFLLWQVRTFIGWFVIALFLAAVLPGAFLALPITLFAAVMLDIFPETRWLANLIGVADMDTSDENERSGSGQDR